jgi:hypothetical protein
MSPPLAAGRLVSQCLFGYRTGDDLIDLNTIQCLAFDQRHRDRLDAGFVRSQYFSPVATIDQLAKAVRFLVVVTATCERCLRGPLVEAAGCLGRIGLM